MQSKSLMILLIIAATVFSVPVYAADVTISVELEQVRARMFLSLHQNMTDFPNQTNTLNNLQDINLTLAFKEALGMANPSAAISDLVLDINSTKTRLNLTASMSISGVAERQGDILKVDTSWKAFNISSDLRAGNMSYNKVGIRYLRPVMDFYVNASKFETNPNATIKAVTFFVNETQSVAGEDAANNVGNLTVFDFRYLNLTLDQWTRSYSFANNTTTWRYTPPPVLAASVRAQQLNETFEIFADYSYSAEIVVPGLARATGNALLVDVGTGQKEWLMTGVVILTLVIAIATQLIFRSRKKALKFVRR